MMGKHNMVLTGGSRMMVHGKDNMVLTGESRMMVRLIDGKFNLGQRKQVPPFFSNANFNPAELCQ